MACSAAAATGAPAEAIESAPVAWTVPERAEAWETGAADAPSLDHRGEADTPEERAEVDRLDALGDEIVRMAGHLHAFQHRYLRKVAEFDRRDGWKPAGRRSCAHWLAVRTGYDLNTCRQHVRVARALESLPHTGRAMAEGRLSFSQVRALTKVATPEHEEAMVKLAEGVPTALLEKMLRGFRRGSAQDEAERESDREHARRFSVFPDHEGMVVVTGRLTPEVGELLMKAIEAAEDALFREKDWHDPEATDRQRRREARRRRADAVGLLAERALAAGFSGPDAPVSGSRAERYMALLHVDRDTLREDAEEHGRSELGATGTRVSADTARRLCCDVGLVPVIRGPGGQVLDVGRKRRTVPPALRRALEVRDRGCRFPGCGMRFTQGHHLEHWADGGPTSLKNCMLLCSFHHRLVHEGGWTVEWWGKGTAEGRGYAVFIDPRGGVHTTEPPEPLELAADPAEAVIRENRAVGADPGPLAASARWKRERDVPDEVWFAAVEAGIAAVDDLSRSRR